MTTMSTGTTQRQRTGAATAYVVLGAACVIAGGLVAAITDPLSLAHGSWLAAYLVLVGGVAQYVFGTVQQPLVQHPDRRADIAQLACWNVGNALVIIGTLLTLPYVVDVGGVLLVIALVAALRQTWHAPADLTAVAYRVVVAILLVSIPIGLVLAHVRA